MKWPDGVIVNPATQRVVVGGNNKPDLVLIPAAVLALRNIDARDFWVRIGSAVDLAAQGYVVDMAQDAYGLIPYDLLVARRKYGYTWVPSLLKNDAPIIAPGIFQPGETPYDADNPPLGAILVPPLGRAVGDPGVVPPPLPPPPPAPVVSPIGPHAGGSRYLFNPLSKDETPDGGVYVENGVTYLKVMRPAFAGIIAKWWEKQ